MKPTRQILREAKSYVARGWCQGAMAKNENGHRVMFDSPAACSWCAGGAVRRACWDIGFEAHTPVWYEVINTLRLVAGPSVAKSNDHADTTKETVLKWFDQAIEVAEKKENANAPDK